MRTIQPLAGVGSAEKSRAALLAALGVTKLLF